MSSESSNDCMSCGICSQGSNPNVSSSSTNTPILEFSSLCLEHRYLPRWQPQADSDYDTDSDAITGKRKQRSEEPNTDIPQKKIKKNEEMECQEVDSKSQMQSETSDDSEDCEADNEEEESVEESGEKCDGACVQEPEMFRMDDEPFDEIVSVTNLFQPSTSGLKRKNYDRFDSPIETKVKRSGSNSE